MNSSTAKLLRKYAVKSGNTYESTKKGWNRTPRPLRGKLRKELKANL